MITPKIIQQFTTEWKDCDHTTYLVEYGVETVATCMVDYDGDNKKHAYLWNLQVKEKWRKQGVARKLIDKACEDAKNRGCKEIALIWAVKDSGGWVLDWYLSLGFKVDDSQYGRPNSIRLVKQLSEPKKR